MHDPLRAIRSHDAAIDAVRPSLVQRLVRQLCEGGPVCGVDGGQQGLVGRDEPLRGGADDAVQFVGPSHRTGRDLALPIPQLGHPLRCGETGFARAQHRLGLALELHVALKRAMDGPGRE